MKMPPPSGFVIWQASCSDIRFFLTLKAFSHKIPSFASDTETLCF